MAQGRAWDKEKVIEVLKPFFQLGYSVTKACKYAGIPQPTVATWILEDEVLRLKIESWQNEISVKARQVLKESIESGDKATASWWAERKERDEFSTRTENVNTEVTLEDLINAFEKPEEPNGETKTAL